MNALITYLKEILFLLDKDARKLPWLLLLFIFSSLLDLIGIGLIGPFITLIVDPEIIVQGSIGKFIGDLGFSLEFIDLVFSIGISLIFIFLFKSLAGILVYRKILQLIVNRQIALQSVIMEGYQKLPYINFISRNSSEYINSLGHLIMTFTGSVLHNGLLLISEISVGILILIFLLYTDIKAMGILLVVLGLSIFFYDKIFRKRLKKHGQTISIGHTEMLKGIQEAFSGFKEIKIFSKNQFFKKIAIDGANKAADSQINAGVLKRAPAFLFEFIIISFIVLYVIVFLSSTNDLGNLAGTLGVFLVASLRLKPIANSILSGFSSARLGRYAVSSIYNDYKLIKSFSTVKIKNKIEKSSFKSLELKNISYKYPNSNDWALNEISLSINSGESIGIIGSSGAGKSTLIDVFLGLLHPQKGEILINNISLSDNYNIWKSKFAYLPQETFIFQNTLKKNITFESDNNDIEISKINDAITRARLNELVSKLPLGLETNLGEHGVRLSGGQRQRVAIARAFYHQREILILDESTSSLDSQTEKEIIDQIKSIKGQRTIIVIAHRLSTVEFCDRIYNLESGKIVNSGTYDYVINKKKEIES